MDNFISLLFLGLYFANIYYCYNRAKSKNRHAIGFAIFALVMPLIAFIVATAISSKQKKEVLSNNVSEDFSFLLEKNKINQANQSLKTNNESLQQTKTTRQVSEPPIIANTLPIKKSKVIATASLLKDVSWDFSKDSYPSPMLFELALVDYNKKMNTAFATNINSIFLPARKAMIHYQSKDGMEHKKEISTYNSGGFTIKEFLYLVNNIVHKKEDKESDYFFEGISQLNTAQDIPSFFINIGQ